MTLASDQTGGGLNTHSQIDPKSAFTTTRTHPIWPPTSQHAIPPNPLQMLSELMADCLQQISVTCQEPSAAMHSVMLLKSNHMSRVSNKGDFSKALWCWRGTKSHPNATQLSQRADWYSPCYFKRLIYTTNSIWGTVCFQLCLRSKWAFVYLCFYWLLLIKSMWM